jgi:hypothetical protein
MAVSGGRLYIGGTFRTVNGVARTAFAALDPVNGLPLSWNPGRDRGVGAFALVATDKGLWIGSDTDASVATSTTPASPSCPWRAAPRSPSPGVGPLPGDLFRLGTDGAMTRRAATATTVGAPTTVTTGVDWSTVRGAFAVGGRLYTGHADSTMTIRDFDGAAAGPATPIALSGLTDTQFPISRVTGRFFWNGRLYYILSGDTRLYHRWFTPESAVIGADTSSPAAPPTAATGPPSAASP